MLLNELQIDKGKFFGLLISVSVVYFLYGSKKAGKEDLAERKVLSKMLTKKNLSFVNL